MRVLVTGATGAIGQSAVTTLAERGHQVRAMTFRRTRATFAALAHPNVERFHADIRDAARVEHAGRLSAPLFDAAMTKSAAWRRYTSVCVYGRPALRPSVVMRWNVQPN